MTMNQLRVRAGGTKFVLLMSSVLAVGLAVSAAALVVGDGQSAERKSKKMPASVEQPPIVPVFARPQPAKNPTALTLLVDERKVVGWIGGEKDLSGQTVSITAGEKRSEVVVQSDNLFTWHFRVAEPVVATFQVGELTRTERLDPPATREPTVFFVVDRTVCRPMQTIRFAGFLRRVDCHGKFAPLANEEVEVRLTSRNKKTEAAKMRLTSDDFGRITGEYQFAAADALDTYDLAIKGYKGTAEVTLAEFRKAKVRLEIDSHPDGDTIKLAFQAVDFLDKPVPGSNVRFTAQVVKEIDRKQKYPLSAREFVYHDPLTAALPRIEDVSEDQRLLWEAGVSTTAMPPLGGSAVVAQRQGDVAMGKTGRGEHTMQLQREWTKGGYSIIVAGVLTDYNGREQRASRKIPLGDPQNETARDRLELSLTPRQFGTGTPIRVGVRPVDKDGRAIAADATVIAMKLSPAPFTAQWANPWIYGNGLHLQSQINSQAYVRPWYRNRSYRSSALRRSNLLWQHVANPGARSVQRELVTATVVKDGAATLELDEPGPYKLVCIARTADGVTLESEVGCIVRAWHDMPGLVLKLDKDVYRTGDIMTGELHSRFAGARVLLTLRDSTGLRFWKTYQLDGTTQRIRQRLPAGLHYGASVEVQYVEADDKIHVANRFLRIEPRERMLTVEAAMQEVYQPGEEITIDLSVNRNEPVDMVVSVYDQSLLGIRADKSVDIRNFYLADERVRYTAARHMARRRLGDVTVKSLVERAEAIIKEDPEIVKTQEGSILQRTVQHYRNSRFVNRVNLEVLLSLAGIHTTPHPFTTRYYGTNWYWQFDRAKEGKSPMRLVDLLDHQRSSWRLRYHFVGDTLALMEYHPSHLQHHLQGVQFGNYRAYGRRAARGDAHFSASANGMFSNVVSGQAFISHLPTATAAPVALIDTDAPGVSVRRDFSDSAFFKANVRTDNSGRAQVKFKLPDSLTNWRVVVTAVSRKMHVGQLKTSFRTFKPIMVWPMVPRIFTEGDKVELYASVHNRTEKPQDVDVTLKVENGRVLTKKDVRVRVPGKSNAPVYWTFQPVEPGFTQLLMTARCKSGSDASLKRLPVSPLVAEQTINRSGFCRSTATLEIPTSVALNDSVMEITLVPSLVDDMVQSLDYLVQYPHGCVEQTMSRFLPALKVAQTLDRAKIDNPALKKKLPGVMDAGIKRLLQLQKPDGGWGWHYGATTHEVSTPYALYGLLLAEKAGYPIPNEQAVQKGLNRLNTFIRTMGEKQAADRIYCMYVYAHRNNLHHDWWAFIDNQLTKDKLSDYALALALEMTVTRGGEARKDLADRLAAALRKRAVRSSDTAYWTTANFSRWGNCRFEITAAVLKALIAHDSDNELIAPTLVFFATTKRGNRWNSTRATAMVIYAVCDHLAAQDYLPGTCRAVTVQVNDREAETVLLEDGKLAKIEIAGSDLHHGENRIRFSGHKPGAMYRAVFRYWKKGRDIKPLELGVNVTRQFYLLDDKGAHVRQIKAGDKVPRGSYILSQVTARHKAGQSMSFVLVENPKPANCEILPVTDKRFNQSSTAYVLREDKTRGVIYHHEKTGHTIVNRCVLHAELAGQYALGPAAVELMYETQTRGHSGTFHFTVDK